eukprot:2514656-Pleurochrysis_carterae.AAC.1
MESTDASVRGEECRRVLEFIVLHLCADECTCLVVTKQRARRPRLRHKSIMSSYFRNTKREMPSASHEHSGLSYASAHAARC